MIARGSLVLREWRESDIAQLLPLRNDVPTQLQLMTRPRPNSAASVRDWLIAKSKQSDLVLFVIASQADDSVLGYLQLNHIDAVNRHASLGICLASSAQGKGHGRAACEAAFAYAAETLCLRKITLEVLSENTRAIALYEKLDFRTIGTLAGHYLQDNRWHDVVLMERMLAS
ncbi:GNAT family N-acetyltransferase [Ralstonia chuxiongensis]|uniref:GNAT family N-acetyltransferase n=1 Tax=Ralstonia chuxiongensis TaxID=2957504 RepID=A0AA41WYZ7_9RALS|nr:GNAT family protein [Ralstonia chuxiongensis]MCP1175002.1 GNAT family N-acetyltransferase [Ralstonia chuxiongensis]